MAHVLLSLLTSAHGTPAYALVFSVLVACGLGLPLPEDVSLVTGGYLSFLGAVQLVPMLMVAFVGILVGDLVIFSAGRKYGNDLTGSRWFSRLVTEDKRCQVEGYFARHGSKLVLMARFLPGVRVVTYFVAGASPMPTWRFLIVDALAACASVPLWMLLGRRLGKHLPTLIVWVERTHRALLVLGLVFLAFGMLTLLRRSRRMVYPKPSFDSASPGGPS